LKVNLEFYNW